MSNDGLSTDAIRLLNEGANQWTTGSVNQAIQSFYNACSLLVPHIVPATAEPVNSNKTDNTNVTQLITDQPTQFRSGVHISTNYFIVAETWRMPTGHQQTSQPFAAAVGLINLAVSMHVVGILFESQPQWIRAAETMYKAAMEPLLDLTGEEPVRLAVCALNNLAAVHHHHGDYVEEWKALVLMNRLLASVPSPIELFGHALYENFRGNILFCSGGPYAAPMA